ncbi:MAG TPA: NADPH-dependent F420 reductase [Burkholderiales bacterium]|jgi:NADPH-dependent F420 reductase|nr:NADPH-dependent F420 reductase [Burkholderiales bacterium]
MRAGNPTVALIGGTGDLGTGLAIRWAAAGYPVIIGSREAGKAAAAAARLAPPPGAPAPRGLANAAAAAAADVVVVTVPFAAHAAILADIRDAVAGKVVIDATVPLVPPKVARVQLPPDDSAAVAAQRALGEGARVVSAFHNVAALKLQKGEPIDCDVLVFGDRPEDREVAIRLAEAAGLRALHAGPLANSTAAEALTSVLIGINRNYRVDGAGIRITGIPAA